MNLNKFLGLFLTVGVCLLLFSACQKEEVVQHTFEETTIIEVAKPLSQSSTKTGTNCALYTNLKKSFCATNAIVYTPLDPQYRYNDISLTTLSGRKYQVKPIKNELGDLDFVVYEKGQPSYVISDTDYWYYKEAGSDIPVSNELKSLYLLEDFLEGTTKISRVHLQQELGGELTIVDEQKGHLAIQLLAEPSASKKITVTHIPYNKYSKVLTVSRYINNIGFSSTSTYEYIVEEALEDCGFSTSYCVDPICVFDEIMGVLTVPSDIEKAKRAFVGYGIGLTETERNLLIGIDSGLLDEFFYFADCDRFYVCSTNMTPIDILHDAITYTLSGSTETSINTFQNRLVEFSWILEDESFSKQKNLKCIWDDLKNRAEGNDNFCSTYGGEIQNSNLNLFLYVNNLNGQNATTGIHPHALGVAVTFDKNYVETACDIQLLRTILHEGIHVYLVQLTWIHGASLDVNYPEINYYYENFGGQWQHECMADLYRTQIEQGLIVKYGSMYTTEQYEALAWVGLMNTDAWGELPQSERDSINAVRTALVNNCGNQCE